MLVHSLWDQEDIYGNIALYKALKAQQPENPNLFLFFFSSGSHRPWFHHQERLERQRDRARSGLAATRPSISDCTCCGRF